MNDIRKVLVTGAGGLIGGIVRRSLAGAYTLSGLDKAPVAGFDSLVADIARLPDILPAFEGVDAVVHLAADAGNERMQEIAAASSEQSGSIAEVSTAISHLDQLTQQNAALVEESAAAAEALKQQAERLAAAVAGFRLN